MHFARLIFNKKSEIAKRRNFICMEIYPVKVFSIFSPGSSKILAIESTLTPGSHEACLLWKGLGSRFPQPFTMRQIILLLKLDLEFFFILQKHLLSVISLKRLH